MGVKRAFKWTIAFTTLLALTIIVLGGSLFFGSNLLYASALKDNKITGPNKKVAIIESYKSETSSAGKKLPGKFNLLYRENLVCSVNQEEFDILSGKYLVVKEKFNNIDIVKISGNKVNQGEIRKILKLESGLPQSCVIIKDNNILYLLFSAHLS